MWKHMRREHREILNEGSFNSREVFRFKITGNYRDPLMRQLTEMVRIKISRTKGFIGGEKGNKFKQKIKCNMNSREEGFVLYIKGKKNKFSR